MARGLDKPPLWAVIVTATMLVVLVALGFYALARDPKDPLSDAEQDRLAAAASAADAADAAEAAPDTITVPANPQLLILGDSYTAGFAADPEDDGWAYLVADALSWPAEIDGLGSTGFIATANGASNAFADRLRDHIADPTFTPNVVIFQGGQNDYRSTPAELAQAVNDLVRETRAAWPDVQIVIMGPSAPTPLRANQEQIDGTLDVTADELDVPYISPYQGAWMTDQNRGQYAHTDGSHLNTAGHAYLADRFMEAFQDVQEAA